MSAASPRPVPPRVAVLRTVCPWCLTEFVGARAIALAVEHMRGCEKGPGPELERLRDVVKRLDVLVAIAESGQADWKDAAAQMRLAIRGAEGKA